MDYIVLGILQARILEWVAFPFSKGSSQPRDQTQVFCIAGKFFTIWASKFRLPSGTSDKKSSCQYSRLKRCGFDLWIGKIPWNRKWQPALVVLPGKSHEQRSLVGYSPWGHKELDTTEQLSTHIYKFMIKTLLRTLRLISNPLRLSTPH